MNHTLAFWLQTLTENPSAQQWAVTAPLVSAKGAINPPSWNTFFLASSDPLPPTAGVLCCSDEHSHRQPLLLHMHSSLSSKMQTLSVCSSEIYRQLLISVCLRSAGSVFSLLNTHWKLPYPEYNICSVPSPNQPQAFIILDREWAYTRYKISSHFWLKLFITFHYNLKSIPIHLLATVRLWTKSPTSFSSSYHLCSLWGGDLFLFAALFPRWLHSLSLPPHLSSVTPWKPTPCLW